MRQKCLIFSLSLRYKNGKYENIDWAIYRYHAACGGHQQVKSSCYIMSLIAERCPKKTMKGTAPLSLPDQST